ncbi:DHH family phosphoesterase [Candidatus Dojkabacteria bacterium]|nr:DHH family phosphoesterase [Candidatus Dojkabacteria bacterium]
MFKDLVSQVKSVLIAGHQTPDFDAYASVLFLGNLIKENYPNVKVTMVIDSEEPFDNLNYLKGFSEIQYGGILEKVKENEAELVALVDGNRLDRFTYSTDELIKLLKGRKSAMFDHHSMGDKDFDFYVREERFSCADVIYEVLVKREGWKTYEGWEETYMTGVIGDTYRFYYKMDGYRDTFEVFADLLDRGYNIRDISDRLFGFTNMDLVVMSKFGQHVSYGEKHARAYITMDEYNQEMKGKMSVHNYKKARRYYVDQVLNCIFGVDFCYTLAPDETFSDGVTYTGSFRSKLDTVDCTILAKYLKGGGHVTGAGFTIKAQSIEDAMKQVEEIIREHYEEAKVVKN